MTTAYTSCLRLAQQGDGDNPNSWGTVLNDGVIGLIDNAIAGYTVVTIGAAATVTLTAVNGATDQTRSAFIEIAGSVGGSHTDITLLIPQESKGYVINNKVSANTTATDTVKIKNAGAGTGYTVPFGSVGLVISSGTSVFATNATGSGTGTAADRDVGVCATNIADVSIGDLRYVRTSVTVNSTVRGDFVVEAGSLKVGTSARAYNPITTLTDAASISIYIIQDGTGSRTLAYNSAWQFVSGTVPTLSTGTDDVDMLVYMTRSAATIDAVLLKNFDR